MMGGGASPSPTPTLIPYIRGGGGPYINTGITPDNNTKIVIWARNYNLFPQTNTVLFGADGGSTTTNAFEFYTGAGTATGKITVCWGNSAVSTGDIVATAISDYHKYEYSKDGLYIDDVQVLAVATKTFSCEYPIYLFGINRVGSLAITYSYKDICACKIYKNNVLVRDFTPVSSPSVGFYDAVSDSVFTNDGEGSLTYGEFDPNAYSRLQYIYCIGGTYFDSLIEGTYDRNFVAKFYPTGTGKYWYKVLGSVTSDGTKRYFIQTGNASYSNARLYFALGSASSTIYSSNSAGAVRKLFYMTKNSNNIKTYYNFATYGSALTISGVDSSFTTGGTIAIGRGQTLEKTTYDTPFVGYIYYVGFSGAKNFVAAEVNGVAGMYETYGDTFFPSESGVPFTPGPYVKGHYEYEDGFQVVRYWDGSESPTYTNWSDDILRTRISLTSVTHGDGYYETSNSSASSATSYGTFASVLPDLYYHWKIVVDIAIKYTSSHDNIGIDFGATQSTTDGTSAFNISMSTSATWGFNAKLNGNSSASTYNPTITVTGTLTESASVQTWVRRTVTFGVRASETDGMDETFAIVEGLGSKVSAPFTPIRFNNWQSGCYIGRSALAPSSSYPYASNVRIYSIKVYRELL